MTNKRISKLIIFLIISAVLLVTAMLMSGCQTLKAQTTRIYLMQDIDHIEYNKNVTIPNGYVGDAGGNPIAGYTVNMAVQKNGEPVELEFNSVFSKNKDDVYIVTYSTQGIESKVIELKVEDREKPFFNIGSISTPKKGENYILPEYTLYDNGELVVNTLICYKNDTQDRLTEVEPGIVFIDFAGTLRLEFYAKDDSDNETLIKREAEIFSYYVDPELDSGELATYSNPDYSYLVSNAAGTGGYGDVGISQLELQSSALPEGIDSGALVLTTTHATSQYSCFALRFASENPLPLKDIQGDKLDYLITFRLYFPTELGCQFIRLFSLSADKYYNSLQKYSETVPNAGCVKYTSTKGSWVNITVRVSEFSFAEDEEIAGVYFGLKADTEKDAEGKVKKGIAAYLDSITYVSTPALEDFVYSENGGIIYDFYRHCPTSYSGNNGCETELIGKDVTKDAPQDSIYDTALKLSGKDWGYVAIALPMNLPVKNTEEKDLKIKVRMYLVNYNQFNYTFSTTYGTCNGYKRISDGNLTNSVWTDYEFTIGSNGWNADTQAISVIQFMLGDKVDSTQPAAIYVEEITYQYEGFVLSSDGEIYDFDTEKPSSLVNGNGCVAEYILPDEDGSAPQDIEDTALKLSGKNWGYVAIALPMNLPVKNTEEKDLKIKVRMYLVNYNQFNYTFSTTYGTCNGYKRISDGNLTNSVWTDYEFTIGSDGWTADTQAISVIQFMLGDKVDSTQPAAIYVEEITYQYEGFVLSSDGVIYDFDTEKPSSLVNGNGCVAEYILPDEDGSAPQDIKDTALKLSGKNWGYVAIALPMNLPVKNTEEKDLKIKVRMYLVNYNQFNYTFSTAYGTCNGYKRISDGNLTNSVWTDYEFTIGSNGWTADTQAISVIQFMLGDKVDSTQPAAIYIDEITYSY